MLGQYQVGIMQGRLLPKYQGRYQAHPKGYWQEEFDLASEAGLDLIEFIIDFILNPFALPFNGGDALLRQQHDEQQGMQGQEQQQKQHEQ